ncbi:MAG: ABC transporter ATP-binding protein [Planctomycetes bacterium]|nr:ABC transporter ATP-binding protein [Planctomycetota bacterium]
MNPQPPKLSLVLRLFQSALGYRTQLMLALGCMMLYGVTKASVAWITKVVFDQGLTARVGSPSPGVPGGVVPPTTPDAFAAGLFAGQPPDVVVLYVGLAILVIAALLFVSEYWSSYFSGFLTHRVLIDLRSRLCRKMLGMSISFFNDRRNGDLISRLTNDIHVTNLATKLLFGDLVKQGWVLLCCLAGMFILDWKLTLIVLTIAPLLAVLLRTFSKRILKASMSNLDNYSELTDEMSQVFTGIRVVKVFHMEDREMGEFDAISERLFSTQMDLTKARASSRAFTSGLSHLGLGIAACGGFLLLYHGYLSPGTLGAFLTLVASMYQPLKAVSRAYNDISEGLGATRRVFELLDAQPDCQDSPDAVPLPDQHTGVRFENVSFAYNGEYVLRDVNFEVKAGELVAIVGQSGAGKSTLLDLIARFYDPQEGKVEVDGLDLRTVRRGSLLDKIAVVTQQTFLFNMSLAENIRYARPDATDEEVMEAAHLAQIDDFIRSLPEGYRAVVGERGVKLSGGQRQRISLARAFLKRAQILILDEASSELDSQTERRVQEALRQVAQGRTTFVVAHRLSSVQGADRILVLEKGRLVEAGSHADLIARNGLYRRLYDLQFSAESQAQTPSGDGHG